MRTVLILMDSLNRHMLGAYGDSWVKTPNIDALAKRGIVFDKHYAGSLPCMPARREFMTGRSNFMETPWSPIQPWDDCLPVLLREQKQTYSHMITDHYHYFHSGGEAYHTLFDSWEFMRGQEGDVWHPLVEEPTVPEFKGKNRRAYWVNRRFMDLDRDEDYSTPQCFMAGMDFLDHNHNADNWHLHIEVFDPHEPFQCPKKYRDMYNDTWDDRYHFDWPAYAPVEEDAEAVEHIRKSYAGTLTMADAWLGKFLAKMDQYDMWKDTTLILTTDHGHLLGEHGYWAKNYMMDYEELAHIPLVVCHPEAAPGRRTEAMTASVDIMPTIMGLFGAVAPPVHGKSLVPVIRKDRPHHDSVLWGYFGKDINLFDGRYTYCRQPLADSVAYHHTAMPRAFHDFIPHDQLAQAECGRFLRFCHDIPHFRFPVPSHRHHEAPDFNPIHDILEDPRQERPLRDDALEAKLAAKMRETMQRYDAPDSEFERVGLD